MLMLNSYNASYNALSEYRPCRVLKVGFRRVRTHSTDRGVPDGGANPPLRGGGTLPPPVRLLTLKIRRCNGFSASLNKTVFPFMVT